MTHNEMDFKLGDIIEAVKDIFVDAGVRRDIHGEKYCLSDYQCKKLDDIYDWASEIILSIREEEDGR